MANKEARKKKRFVKKLRGEVSIVIAIVLTVLAIPVSMVYTQAMLSESNIELEAIKNANQRTCFFRHNTRCC